MHRKSRLTLSKIFFGLSAVVLILAAGCKPKPSAPVAATAVETVTPVFSGDSAYSFVARQVAFGPRVPGTPAHAECAAWLASKLRSFGAEVSIQEGSMKAFDGKQLPIKNIIARFQPEKSNRLLLMAHWDTRPFADHDPDPARRDSPIPGANDGGSGTAVLLEIARCLQQSPSTLGIDLILFDSEDYGAPAHRNVEEKPEYWCLGSQYWAKNPHVPGYFARFGILLDMVGAPDAEFAQEEVSIYYAKSVLDKVWATASKLGYGKYFAYRTSPQLIDDHRFVNEIIGIPSIDIIQLDPATESNFNKVWHTHADDMSNISRNTLEAVGRTVVKVIYGER